MRTALVVLALVAMTAAPATATESHRQQMAQPRNSQTRMATDSLKAEIETLRAQVTALQKKVDDLQGRSANSLCIALHCA